MKLYRYELNKSETDLKLLTYDVHRETPKCYVIRKLYSPKDKFILKNAKSKFAYETEERALTNYIKRTEKWISTILEYQLRKAKFGLRLAMDLREKGDK